MEAGMKGGIKIRKTIRNDLRQITAIHESVRKKRVSRQWIEITARRLRKGLTVGFVALEEKQVVGFIFGEIKGEGFGLEQSGWIEFIGVDPNHMGSGIGRGLAAKLFQYFKQKGVREIYTTVQWDSTDMLSFFKSLGFDRSPFINLMRRLD
jgi:ribosomal protein S18 acetylase RimI-like enzyme